MQREYFCCGCGLFHWVDIYKKDEETGRIDYVGRKGCPNEECISHNTPDVPVFAVDTFGYAYFAESHPDFIEKMKWSSPKYAPEHAIEIYRKQGMPIYPCCRACSSVTQSEIDNAIDGAFKKEL